MNNAMQKIIVGFLACFSFTMILENSFAEGTRNHSSVVPGKIVIAGTLINPGPHKICVGQSPPAFKVEGTLIEPSTDMACLYSAKVVSDPPVPETFNDLGRYTYKVSVKGIPIPPLYSNSQHCPTLGPEYIGNFTVDVEEELCCDQCSEGDKSVDIDIYFKHWSAKYSPEFDLLAQRQLENVFLIQQIIDKGALVGSCGSFVSLLLTKVDQKLAEMLINIPTKKILEAIRKIKKALIKNQGVRVWGRLRWKECEEKVCWLFSKKMVWKEKNTDWYPCSIGHKDPDHLFGLGYGMEEAEAANEINEAIPQCIKEAINSYRNVQ